MNRPVSVSFVIDGLSRAGTETQLVALIRALDRAEVTPSLVLLDGTPAASRELEPAECPVLRLGLRSLHSPGVFAAAAKLVHFWRRHSVDVVQTYFLDSTYFAAPLARACGVKRVVRVRNNLGHWLTPRHAILGRVMGRVADVTLTNSEPGRAALWRAERLGPGRVRVLENGVDVGRFMGLRPIDTQRTDVHIGALANLRSVKAIDVLIRAAADLPGRFTVAGEGEDRPELERMIRDFGLTDRFRLPGNVADVTGFLGSLDIAVVCSRAEGMSNALLEAMAAGRAIVATDVGANARLIRDGEHGRVVPPDDAAALARAIAEYRERPEFAARCAAAAQARAAAEFSREAMRRRFEGFYRKLVA